MSVDVAEDIRSYFKANKEVQELKETVERLRAAVSRREALRDSLGQLVPLVGDLRLVHIYLSYETSIVAITRPGDDQVVVRVVEAEQSYQVEYPDPGPPPSIDLPTEPVDDDEDPAELAGWAKMGHGIPAEASLALDEAVGATP
jgi:hypothetical protein